MPPGVGASSVKRESAAGAHLIESFGVATGETLSGAHAEMVAQEGVVGQDELLYSQQPGDPGAQEIISLEELRPRVSTDSSSSGGCAGGPNNNHVLYHLQEHQQQQSFYIQAAVQE